MYLLAPFSHFPVFHEVKNLLSYTSASVMYCPLWEATKDKPFGTRTSSKSCLLKAASQAFNPSFVSKHHSRNCWYTVDRVQEHCQSSYRIHTYTQLRWFQVSTVQRLKNLGLLLPVCLSKEVPKLEAFFMIDLHIIWLETGRPR